MRYYHFFRVETIAESVNLIRCQNRIENCYHHDGEQLGFYKKVYISKYRTGCSCNLYISRNEECQI